MLSCSGGNCGSWNCTSCCSHNTKKVSTGSASKSVFVRLCGAACSMSRTASSLRIPEAPPTMLPSSKPDTLIDRLIVDLCIFAFSWFWAHCEVMLRTSMGRMLVSSKMIFRMRGFFCANSNRAFPALNVTGLLEMSMFVIPGWIDSTSHTSQADWLVSWLSFKEKYVKLEHTFTISNTGSRPLGPTKLLLKSRRSKVSKSPGVIGKFFMSQEFFLQWISSHLML
mmetsp:Transcript_117731/g.204986  ORF Transcript_117731/g.204986 Transcript_117731/m.204986 type:complete len:224 (-) Transcript_117731:122-793(-)